MAIADLMRADALDEFETVLEELRDLHRRKQADYGSEEDEYQNVVDSREWGVEPWIGASVRLSDKERRLKRYALTANLTNEAAEDSALDNGVYNIIRLILLRRKLYGSNWHRKGERKP